MRNTDTVHNLSKEEKQALLEHIDVESVPLALVAQRYGIEVVEAVMNELGGEKPHIPMKDNFWAKLSRDTRNEQIRRRFCGNNYSDLAEMHGLDVSTVRKVVHRRNRGTKRVQEKSSPVKVDNLVYDLLSISAKSHGVSIRKMASTVLALALDSEEIQRFISREFSA